MQFTMEWKPKSSQKPAIISPSASGTASAPSSSQADDSIASNLVDVTNLSKKLSEVNVLEERHVIIPQHLRVPESERTQLTFGSFGTGFDSTNVSSSVSQAFESVQRSSDGPSVRLFPFLTHMVLCMWNTVDISVGNGDCHVGSSK